MSTADGFVVSTVDAVSTDGFGLSAEKVDGTLAEGSSAVATLPLSSASADANRSSNEIGAGGRFDAAALLLGRVRVPGVGFRKSRFFDVVARFGRREVLVLCGVEVVC